MSVASIQVVLSEFHIPAAGTAILAQLACGPGPGSGCDYELTDIGLDEQTIDALAARSCDDSAIREVGERLMTALRRKESIRTALENARGLQQCPISLILTGPMGNRLPWETLFDSSWPGFLEFMGTMPTSRAVAHDRSGTSPAFLDRPRILAVLSAPGQAGANGPPGFGDWSHTEFKQLTDAVYEAGVGADLHVLTSEPSVLIAAGAAGVPVRQIKDEDSVIGEIESFDPHFLHFFCHGFDEPSPHLRLYRPADVHTGQPQLSIDADMLTRHIGCTCLVILNSCSGASERQSTQSMAQALVSKRFPAVIGMKEPVEWHDATRFTFALYRHMLTALRSYPGDRIDLRLLAGLESPRRALLSRFGPSVPTAAEQHREWTLPVIYTRPNDFTLPVISEDRDEPPDIRARREGEHLAIRSVADNLHHGTPGEVVEHLSGFADHLTGQGQMPEQQAERAEAAEESEHGRPMLA